MSNRSPLENRDSIPISINFQKIANDLSTNQSHLSIPSYLLKSNKQDDEVQGVQNINNFNNANTNCCSTNQSNKVDEIYDIQLSDKKQEHTPLNYLKNYNHESQKNSKVQDPYTLNDAQKSERSLNKTDIQQKNVYHRDSRQDQKEIRVSDVDESNGSVSGLERENSNVKREFLRRLYSRDKSKEKVQVQNCTETQSRDLSQYNQFSMNRSSSSLIKLQPIQTNQNPRYHENNLQDSLNMNSHRLTDDSSPLGQSTQNRFDFKTHAKESNNPARFAINLQDSRTSVQSYQNTELNQSSQYQIPQNQKPRDYQPTSQTRSSYKNLEEEIQNFLQHSQSQPSYNHTPIDNSQQKSGLENSRYIKQHEIPAPRDFKTTQDKIRDIDSKISNLNINLKTEEIVTGRQNTNYSYQGDQSLKGSQSQEKYDIYQQKNFNADPKNESYNKGGLASVTFQDPNKRFTDKNYESSSRDNIRQDKDLLYSQSTQNFNQVQRLKYKDKYERAKKQAERSKLQFAHSEKIRKNQQQLIELQSQKIHKLKTELKKQKSDNKQLLQIMQKHKEMDQSASQTLQYSGSIVNGIPRNPSQQALMNASNTYMNGSQPHYNQHNLNQSHYQQQQQQLQYQQNIHQEQQYYERSRGVSDKSKLGKQKHESGSMSSSGTFSKKHGSQNNHGKRNQQNLLSRGSQGSGECKENNQQMSMAIADYEMRKNQRDVNQSMVQPSVNERKLQSSSYRLNQSHMQGYNQNLVQPMNQHHHNKSKTRKPSMGSMNNIKIM
eukprot:403354034